MNEKPVTLLLIDDLSYCYYVGRIQRLPSQLKPHLRKLQIGETYWEGNLGWERES